MSFPVTFKLTSLNVGETLTGTVVSAEAKSITTKSGQSFEGVYITLNTDDGVIQVQTAGNVKKFFKEDQEKGRYNKGNLITITRKEDVTLKNGFKTSHFTVLPVNQTVSTSAPAANVTPLSKKAELEAKLKAQRANAK